VRSSHSFVLESYGYRILSAPGGKEGIDLVERVLPDAVLLDLLMPEVDGWQVYRELKWNSETEDIPVVVITAKQQPEEAIKKQFPQGVEGYIVKPFGPYEVVSALDRIFSGLDTPLQRPQPESGAPKIEQKARAVEESGGSQEERIAPQSETVRTKRRPVRRRRNRLIAGIEKSIAAVVAVVYLLRYAASFISSSFRDKT